jgi:hypothetical protein
MVHQQAIDLRPQSVEVLQILGADGSPSDLVLVSWTDAASRGAYAPLAGGRFAELIELAVQRQDQGGVLGNAQILGVDHHALLLEAYDLVAQGPRIDHHAVADDAQLAAAHDAGRQQRQLEGLIADHQCMAGVVAALEAYDDVGALRQPVDNLALALISPLGADHHHIRHCRQSPPSRQRG